MNYRYGFGDISGELLAILAIVGIAAIVVAILFLLNLQRTLEAVSDHNRQIGAGRVWLMLIPLFSIGYAFYLFPKMSESLRLEFQERENPQTGDYGLVLGRAYAIISVVGLFDDALGDLGSLISVGALVVMILLWVKMAKFKNMLNSGKRNDGMSNRTDILD